MTRQVRELENGRCGLQGSATRVGESTFHLFLRPVLILQTQNIHPIVFQRITRVTESRNSPIHRFTDFSVVVLCCAIRSNVLSSDIASPRENREIDRGRRGGKGEMSRERGDDGKDRGSRSYTMYPLCICSCVSVDSYL